MMRAAEEGPHARIDPPFYYPLKHSVTLLNNSMCVKKKSIGFTEMFFFCRGWTSKKILAHCDG